ncbi:hypothetical protein CYLTODRAFT_425664, partial [Cylindrobasidium torrendii FP15055 ss-10]
MAGRTHSFIPVHRQECARTASLRAPAPRVGPFPTIPKMHIPHLNHGCGMDFWDK